MTDPEDGPGLRVENVQVDHYRVPLPEVLSDATHGEISHFQALSAALSATMR